MVSRIVHIPDVAAMPASDFIAWLRLEAPESASLALANQVFQRLKKETWPNLRPLSIAFLRSSTLEPLLPFLAYQLGRAGFDARLQLSGYADWRVLAENPASDLWQQNPKVIIVALDLPVLSPELALQFASLDAAQVEGAIQRVIDELLGLVEALRRDSDALILIHNFPLIAWPCQGLLDSQSELSQNDAIWRLNRALTKSLSEQPGVFIFDLCGWTAREGLAHVADHRMWLTSRMWLSGRMLDNLAQEYVRYLKPLLGVRRKCLVLDLDNTLWGGILGEDGPEGIQIGHSYPGNAYREFQQAVLDLYHRGIILAVCSKNNPDDAIAVLENHPDIVLRPQYFATMQINWDDKVTNLRRIASDLNIGLDSLVFIDDNPAERALIRQVLPEVLVPEWPSRPEDYALALRRLSEFETFRLSEEDRLRGAQYRAQVERKKLQDKAESLEGYYRSLDMVLHIGQADTFTIPRIAQLTQKTNQFNLTTRRYSEADIARMSEDPSWRVYYIRVVDRFGDNGITGVAILHDLGEGTWEIDTFLLSCRIIGRTVETAFLAYLVEQARLAGANRIEGWFYPTARNNPARDVYSRHGFRLVQEQDSGSLWELELDRARLVIPDWFTVKEYEAGRN